VCDGAYVPVAAGDAVAMMHGALDFLAGPGGDGVEPTALGGLLESLASVEAKHAAARARLLMRFDAHDCHDADGYQSTASWLAGRTKMTLADARAEVKRARKLVRQHPGFGDAMAAGWLSGSWAAALAKWTKDLPEEARARADEILLEAAAQGADIDDLKMLCVVMEEAWRRENGPDGGENSFDDRFVHTDITMDGAGRITGDLTPECAAAVQAVLEALGKKRGKEDTRTSGERYHDALQEACELLIRARMVPDRSGSDTHVDVHISLADLLEMDGASGLEEAWLHAKAGEHGYLTGKDAQAVACDALIAPVVLGCPDWGVIGQMITLVLDAFGWHGDRAPDRAPLPLPPEAWEALQYALAKLSIGFLSGPGGLASVLRTGLLPEPFNTRSVPIDVGYSKNIPEPIRRAVLLRDKRCAWPGGCNARPARCDVHHTRHKKHGGATSVRDCILLCQFHHDICIHRWGWEIEVLPDGVRATGPDGQMLRSHGPPPARAA